MGSARATPYIDRWQRRSLILHAAAQFRDILPQLLSSAGDSVDGRGGCEGRGSDIGAGPELVPSGVPENVGCDGLYSIYRAVLITDRDDDSSALVTPGAISSVPVEGRVAAGSGGGGGSGDDDGGGLGGDGRGGLADGEVAGGGCAVVKGDDGGTDLAGGGHNDGWDGPLHGDCCGRG